MSEIIYNKSKTFKIKIMNFRKKFNIQNTTQKLKVIEDFRDVFNRAFKSAKEKNNESANNVVKYNNTCPSCKSNNIVEKIIGYKYEGFGIGSTLKKCRHCGNCGNDWMGYEPKFIYNSDILCQWFIQLSNMIGNGKTKEEILNECKFFNNIHAESFKSIQEMIIYCENKPKHIGLKKLREIFKSVFDDH